MAYGNNNPFKKSFGIGRLNNIKVGSSGSNAPLKSSKIPGVNTKTTDGKPRRAARLPKEHLGDL